MRKWWSDERGSATMEFVLWVPLFVFMLVAMADATFTYLNYTEMLNASRDAARRVAIGQYDATNVVSYVQSSVLSNKHTVSADITGQTVTVTISRPFKDIMAFSVFSGLFGENLTTSVQMRIEPGVLVSNAATS